VAAFDGCGIAHGAFVAHGTILGIPGFGAPNVGSYVDTTSERGSHLAKLIFTARLPEFVKTSVIPASVRKTRWFVDDSCAAICCATSRRPPFFKYAVASLGSRTIEMPASLRSDRVRDHPGISVDIARILSAIPASGGTIPSRSLR
jgi:hypothetical protein